MSPTQEGGNMKWTNPVMKRATKNQTRNAEYFQLLNKVAPLLRGLNVTIKRVNHYCPYYHIEHRLICMPPLNRFKSSGHYFAGLLHEIGHWSGDNIPNCSRSVTAGSPAEECLAELVSLNLRIWLGLPEFTSMSAAYVDIWSRSGEDVDVEKVSQQAAKITSELLKRCQYVR